MTATYPKLKLRQPFSRARAVLYEDYLAIEHVHSFGLFSEANRAYYDEIRWVIEYQKRDWARAVQAALLAVPFLIGLALLLATGESVAQVIGLAFLLPSGLMMVYAVYRLLAVKVTLASIQSSRGEVVIGTDWPRSSNPQKDARVFFKAFLAKLDLVADIPDPAAPVQAPLPPPAESSPPP